MKKAALAAVAAFVIAAPASAAQYLLSYTATDAAAPLTASLLLTTANTLNAVGGYDVLSLTGSVTGDVITALTPNPSQPYPASSADGIFTFDNVLYPTAAFVSDSGLLFTSAAHEYNLFSDSTAQYELYQVNPGVGITANSIGTLLVVAVPEPGQWALMLGGFGLMGGAIRRRRSETTAHPYLAMA